jgi:hypothetical protein
MAKILTVRRILETCCIIGIWVRDHLLREVGLGPLGMSLEVTAMVY